MEFELWYWLGRRIGATFRNRLPEQRVVRRSSFGPYCPLTQIEGNLPVRVYRQMAAIIKQAIVVLIISVGS